MSFDLSWAATIIGTKTDAKGLSKKEPFQQRFTAAKTAACWSARVSRRSNRTNVLNVSEAQGGANSPANRALFSGDFGGQGAVSKLRLTHCSGLHFSRAQCRWSSLVNIEIEVAEPPAGKVASGIRTVRRERSASRMEGPCGTLIPSCTSCDDRVPFKIR